MPAVPLLQLPGPMLMTKQHGPKPAAWQVGWDKF